MLDYTMCEGTAMNIQGTHRTLTPNAHLSQLPPTPRPHTASTGMASSTIEDICKLLSSDSEEPTSYGDNNDNEDDDSSSILTVKPEGPASNSKDEAENGRDHRTTGNSSRRRFSTSAVPSLPLMRSSSRLSVASYSTWSTNMTMSNLVGAGRMVGNFYSFAGRRLEKGVLRIVATSTARGPNACADRLLSLCQSFFAGWPFRELPVGATSNRGALAGEERDRLLMEVMGPDCERLLRYGSACVCSF